MAAIWKDYFVTIPSLAAADFRIHLNSYSGRVIYEGRAVAKPTAPSIVIRINDICADYLRATVPNFDLRFTAGLLSLTFYIQYKATTTSSWTNYGTVTFTNDWSYDYTYLASRDGYSFPISQIADPRQDLLVTVPSGVSSVTATLTFTNGQTLPVTIPVMRTADFNNDYNGDYSHLSDAAQAGVVMLHLASYPDVAKVVMRGITWAVDNGRCRDYAVYYVNAYGGWDALPVYGYQQLSYTRHDYSVDYDNNQQSAIGRVDYLNEEKIKFTLFTGMLKELGSSRIHNLIGTNCAVIHELSTGRILPITVTSDTVKTKTYRSEGRTPISYEFEVEVAQDRQRR